jgi:hypothetical protein
LASKTAKSPPEVEHVAVSTQTMKKTLGKIVEYFWVSLGFLFMIAFFGFLAGGLTIFLLRTLVPSLPLEAVTPPANNIADWRSLVVIAIGCLAILCFFLIQSLVSRTPWMIQHHAIATQRTEQEKHRVRRKRWIIGLSLLALFFAYHEVNSCVTYYKRFNKADMLVTGHVVEFDPGEPGAPGDAYDAGDPGQPAASRYEFKVNGKTYEGWIEDELSKGEPIVVLYNSSDPNFNHAQDEHADWLRTISYPFGFLLLIVLVALVWFVRNKQQPEYR